jgi:hypothetical protein
MMILLTDKHDIPQGKGNVWEKLLIFSLMTLSLLITCDEAHFYCMGLKAKLRLEIRLLIF